MMDDVVRKRHGRKAITIRDHPTPRITLTRAMGHVTNGKGGAPLLIIKVIAGVVEQTRLIAECKRSPTADENEPLACQYCLGAFMQAPHVERVS